ncbi:hypothetical protein Tco_0695731 [Tanacetum coccineum]
MHSEGQDSPLTKPMNTVVGKFKFRMEIPDIMINDAIKQSPGYKYYKHKRNESEKSKLAEEPKEQYVSPVRSGKGKGYMHSGDQEANVPSAFKKNVVPRKTRSLTVAKQHCGRTNTDEVKDDETDDSDDSNMDLSNDEPKGVDDDA